MAGVIQSPTLLIIGVIINGIASPLLFTTNLSIIREETNEIMTKFGDARRTQIVESSLEDINVEDIPF